MSSFQDRLVRAVKLDAHLYEEVEADAQAMAQAMGVVVLSSVAAGIGVGRAGIGGMFWGAVAALLSWYIWAYLTFLIGTKLLPEPQTHATPGELLRTLGFSSAPGFIRALGILPGMASIVFPVAAVWMLAAMVIAVRQALDYSSTWRAVAVCATGWLVQTLLLAVLLALLRGAP